MNERLSPPNYERRIIEDLHIRILELEKDAREIQQKTLIRCIQHIDKELKHLDPANHPASDEALMTLCELSVSMIRNEFVKWLEDEDD